MLPAFGEWAILILIFDSNIRINYRAFEVIEIPASESPRPSVVRGNRRTMPTDNDTEERIFEAARKVFVERGPSNARMQDIAEEAGITSSLLHYYFRSREQLFAQVFEKEVLRVIPRGRELLESDRPLQEKLARFSEMLIEFHGENPHLAVSVVYEAHYDPDRLQGVREALRAIDLTRLQDQVDRRVSEGTMRSVSAEDLLTNVVALSVFPVLARPVLQAVLGIDGEEAFEEFLDGRSSSVPAFVEAAIQPPSDS